MKEIRSQRSEVSSQKAARSLALSSLPLALSLVVTILLALCLSVDAQEQPKVHKIGFLGARQASGPGAGSEAIRHTLHELGYVEGKNIAFESRYADDKLDRLPVLADELVRLNVNLLLTPAPPAALAAKSPPRAIPIVFYNVGDPVADGLVDSLARPGGNITGVTTFATLLVGKQLELLKETIPKLSRGCSAVESAGSKLRPTMERKSLPGARTALAT